LSFGLTAIDKEYKDEGLVLPIEYTKYIWGWPYRFLKKIYDADVRFYIFANTKLELEQVSNVPLDGYNHRPHRNTWKIFINHK
jgi:hypothetical protein